MLFLCSKREWWDADSLAILSIGNLGHQVGNRILTMEFQILPKSVNGGPEPQQTPTPEGCAAWFLRRWLCLWTATSSRRERFRSFRSMAALNILKRCWQILFTPSGAHSSNSSMDHFKYSNAWHMFFFPQEECDDCPNRRPVIRCLSENDEPKINVRMVRCLFLPIWIIWYV